MCDRLLANGGIDDQIDLTVDNHIDDVGSAFVDLQGKLRRDIVLNQFDAGAPGRDDLEAQFVELACDRHRPVPAVVHDVRQAGLSARRALVNALEIDEHLRLAPAVGVPDVAVEADIDSVRVEMRVDGVIQHHHIHSKVGVPVNRRPPEHRPVFLVVIA